MQLPEESKQVVYKMPEDIIKIINEAVEKRGKFTNLLFNISIQEIKMRREQDKMLKQIENINLSIQNKIKYAFDKLKLKKKKNYQFKFDGKENFIGTLRELKKVEKENVKVQKVSENNAK